MADGLRVLEDNIRTEQQQLLLFAPFIWTEVIRGIGSNDLLANVYLLHVFPGHDVKKNYNDSEISNRSTGATLARTRTRCHQSQDIYPVFWTLK